MLKSIWCDYTDAYILPKETTSVTNTAVAPAAPDNRNKKVVFKNHAPFTNCISELNNTLVDDVEDIDALMVMYK